MHQCIMEIQRKLLMKLPGQVIDATQVTEKDLFCYDLIGFASGVYYGKFHQSVLKFASVNLIENKNIFLMQLNVTLFKYTNEILGV